MKKIFLSVLPVALATFTWHAISSFTKHSATEDVLREKIAALEKQISMYKSQLPACSYQYFDNETELRKFISANYNSNFNYSTMAANSTSLIKSLSSFPANSTVYVSIIYGEKGKDLKISNGERICNPFNICCPPNCTPPPRPKTIALPQSFNPYAKF